MLESGDEKARIWLTWAGHSIGLSKKSRVAPQRQPPPATGPKNLSIAGVRHGSFIRRFESHVAAENRRTVHQPGYDEIERPIRYDTWK